MNGLSGKVAVVTGGAGGVGAAVVRGFNAAGVAAAVADIDQAAGQALADELGDRVLFCPTDVTDDAQIANCVETATAAFGGIDFLVNAAVTYHDAGLDSAREEWLRSYNLNVVSVARMLQAVAPAMRRRGGGAAVNFSSIAGKFGQSGRALYPATKAAIRQLTRNQAMHHAPDRIRVNVVSPGWTWAGPIPGLAGGDLAKADRVAADYFPLGRVARAEDVAAAVLFLCSEAASFVTGIDLPVDGGYAITGPDQGRSRMHRLSE
jgi:NAD(P)-dependent dehydrogenase (short-subunit alcohol dehydrogenase family)